MGPGGGGGDKGGMEGGWQGLGGGKLGGGGDGGDGDEGGGAGGEMHGTATTVSFVIRVQRIGFCEPVNHTLMDVRSSIIIRE